MDEQTQMNDDSVEKLKELLEESQKQRDEYLNGWQRAKADLINYKKDEMKRLEEVAQYAGQDLVKDLIVVLDSFDLAIAALEKAGPVEKGVYMIKTQIEDVLKKRGLQRIPIVIGEDFNPAIAEAIAEGHSDEHPPGSVIEEIEPGYRLHDKVLRPARVKLAKEKS